MFIYPHPIDVNISLMIKRPTPTATARVALPVPSADNDTDEDVGDDVGDDVEAQEVDDGGDFLADFPDNTEVSCYFGEYLISLSNRFSAIGLFDFRN